jgi:hypothetical protein
MLARATTDAGGCRHRPSLTPRWPAAILRAGRRGPTIGSLRRMGELDLATVAAANDAWVLAPEGSEVVETAEYRLVRFPERFADPLQVQWVRSARPAEAVLEEVVARAVGFGLPEAHVKLGVGLPLVGEHLLTNSTSASSVDSRSWMRSSRQTQSFHFVSSTRFIARTYRLVEPAARLNRPATLCSGSSHVQPDYRRPPAPAPSPTGRHSPRPAWVTGTYVLQAMVGSRPFVLVTTLVYRPPPGWPGSDAARGNSARNWGKRSAGIDT